MPDGSFAQHSTNYHRLALDTLSLVEFWRRRFKDRPFSDEFYGRFRAAAEWLCALTDPASGEAPNLGANDGARIAALHRMGYRDFRPAITLAHALWATASTMPEGEWNEPLEWLGIESQAASPVRGSSSALYPNGGYAKLARGRTWCLLRLPGFKFRPSHCDVLHLDLWHNGTNLLRDGGSYSYNCLDGATEYFAGTASHNTIAFDGRDQMPWLGRFLFGSWPDREQLSFDPEAGKVCAAYRDFAGARHCRSVTLDQGACMVRDEIEGFRAIAVMRWRLAPGDWRQDGYAIRSMHGMLSISATAAPVALGIAEGFESLHYGARSRVPVFEAAFDRPAAVTTTIQCNGAA
jgi:hypothetical protein